MRKFSKRLKCPKSNFFQCFETYGNQTLLRIFWNVSAYHMPSADGKNFTKIILVIENKGFHLSIPSRVPTFMEEFIESVELHRVSAQPSCESNEYE